MRFVADAEAMWVLSDDRKRVHLDVPPRLAGVAEPIAIRMHFDQQTVDAIIERLILLRSRMLPVPRKRNCVDAKADSARPGRQ